ncbi:hypothetical protein QFC22_002320 [Naganishia vaughanmartiniae]|uniref:Uncharacterized protein n=1 Tax=Naganishia vaughanmartiniae TaxID=1424756 RepID=A0ACC2XDL7_9TREE|nr:hypothetical protein QFC22_002320 [Naganishia vaughanmartiniae]
MPRLATITSSITPTMQLVKSRGFATSSIRHSLDKLRQKNRDDVVITFAKRTALTRAKKGGFRDTTSDQLLYSFLSTAMPLSGVPHSAVQDIIAGVCHTPSPAYEVRAAALAAGFPETTPVEAVNRLCSSGLMAVRHVSDSIARGELDVGLAIGYESMSNHPRPTPVFGSEAIRNHAASVDCAKPMGWTSEMLALDYDVSREKQDTYGLVSHTRASAAQKSGKFKDEIVPLRTTVLVDPKDPSNTAREEITVHEDDGIRHGLTMDKMRTAKPAFKDYGEARSTGPNSSQVTDGAAMLLMMPRWKAEQLGLDVLAKHVGTSVVGCTPRVMGVGPVYAIP